MNLSLILQTRGDGIKSGTPRYSGLSTNNRAAPVD